MGLFEVKAILSIPDFFKFLFLMKYFRFCLRFVFSCVTWIHKKQKNISALLQKYLKIKRL